ncbi:thiamine phosphate synthase [Fimbriiglobus ruber]|uniref:Thiamine-phosphate synthase n=1 Tax=Fimbriiglobus ruber TaxID=1908690 RepID=A0A225DTS1_9BACT|nr:thiamine phosphate synthase [Fimbriiglobus ruber]OWK41938.1 Thiamin-phosphate pyrophosphorylase [Fimbriiglobus ruber]
MKHDLSPAVERARDAALGAADRNGTGVVRLTDWLLGLLEEDEGKPASLLERTGADLADVRAALGDRGDWLHPPAPSEYTIYAAARERGLVLRGDPALTSEFVFLALLNADAGFRDQLAGVGVRVDAIEALLDAKLYVAAPADDAEPVFVVPESTEHIDAARVVDANLNRAREAFRVLDDYCRFVLDDRVLTEEVKAMRHDLAAASARIPPALLLAARNTPGDVGTDVTAGGEYARESPSQVAAVNLKRAQEALRSIEEYGKVFGPELGRAVEAVRYRAYTLERAVLAGATARGRLAGAKLYVLLTGAQCVSSLDFTIAEAAAGGAQVFQLREKTMTDRELIDRAERMRRWTRDAGVLYIVNDRPDVARLVGADGVHLGQDDLPVAAARRIVGPDALIGVSTHTPEQVRRAVLDGADYIGVGPTFPSRTKEFDHFPGLDFVRFVAAETSLPAFALGGINLSNAGQVVEAGLTRVAVSSAIAEEDEPQPVAARFRQILGG